MFASINKSLIEKRWALAAIFLGVLWGFGSAIICVAWNLVIFGFNIMYIVSPLLAGFVETYVAREKYGKSTGAISALLTFILINGYGWFSPGWIFPKEPVSLSLITIIAILLTIQAAFPTLINYILFVTVVGIFKKIIEFIVYIPSKIMRKPPEVEEKEEIINEPSMFESFLEELDMPLLSVFPEEGNKIEKYIGLVTGVAIAKEKETEGKLSMLTNMIEPTQLDDLNLEEARKIATSRMLDNAKSLGANNVVDVIIDYIPIGGLQGSALTVTATGTAVITDNNSKTGEMDAVSSKSFDIENSSISSIIEEISQHDNDINIQTESKISKMSKKRKFKEIPVTDMLSGQIDEFLNDQSERLIKDWELATKSDLNILEKKYSKVIKDIDDLEKQFNEYQGYDDKKFENIENRLSCLESEKFPEG